MRTLFGVGTPRSLQGRVVALALIAVLRSLIGDAIAATWSQRHDHTAIRSPIVRALAATSVP